VLPVIATAVPAQADSPSANGDAAGSKASSKNSSSNKSTAATKATSKGDSDDDEDDDDDKEKSKAAVELAKELATLPDTAHFYFKKGPSGHMEVDLMINGHPVKALFDTGASAFFYKDQLKEAGLDLNKAKVGQGARGWAGVKVDTEIIPAVVKLGTMTRNINITMQETTGHLGQNLIGQDFIKGYQYEIDDKGGRVDLKKTLASANSKIDRLYDIPLEVVGTKDYIGFSVNGVYAKAFIDTGASNTIFNALWAAKAGIQPTGETVHMSGVGGNVEMQRAYVTIRIGGMYRENFPVLIGGAAGCALGQDLMDGWRYKVDRERKLLRFFH
jgi:predicted aspartyl protease